MEIINPVLVGLRSPDNMLNRSKNIRLADRTLTGMNANGSAALGLGFTHSTSYASTGRQLGLSAMVSTTRDIFTIGKSRPDGRYLEACISVGAAISAQFCAGWSWSANNSDH